MVINYEGLDIINEIRFYEGKLTILKVSREIIIIPLADISAGRWARPIIMSSFFLYRNVPSYHLFSYAASAILVL